MVRFTPKPCSNYQGPIGEFRVYLDLPNYPLLYPQRPSVDRGFIKGYLGGPGWGPGLVPCRSTIAKDRDSGLQAAL